MSAATENSKSTVVFVHLQGTFVPAGQIDSFRQGDRHASTFTYDASYVARPDAVAVDPESLPLPPKGMQPEPLTTDYGFELFDGIRDAAPDAWGQWLVIKAAGRALSEFDCLLASGDDRVGALAFGPDRAQPPRRTVPWTEMHDIPRLDIHALTDITNEIMALDDVVPGHRGYLNQGAALGGARPKASVTHEGALWLAKFSRPGDTYDVMRAEHAVMTLAAECGLDVPRTQSLQIGDTTVYMIERFDRRTMDGGAVHRVPFASALTMLAAHEMMTHRYDYVDIADTIRKHGSAAEEDNRELFRRMAFNILVSNSDDHLRNHGFLYDGHGWRLSPGYDIVPKPETGHERRLCLGVGDRGKEASLVNAMTQCTRFGLSEDEAEDTLETMRTRVAARWEGVCREVGVPAKDFERLATCFVVANRTDWRQELVRQPKR